MAQIGIAMLFGSNYFHGADIAAQAWVVNENRCINTRLGLKRGGPRRYLNLFLGISPLLLEKTVFLKFSFV